MSSVFVPEAYDTLNKQLQGRLMRCVYADRRFCQACAERFDGLLLPGGGDIHPAHFDQIDRYSTGIEVQLDRMQFYLAEAFVSVKKPVFGICKGMQLLNVLFGGNLHQELPPEQKARHAYDKEHEKDRVHGSWLTLQFPPAARMQTEIMQQRLKELKMTKTQMVKESLDLNKDDQQNIYLRINSAHHQAIDKPGDGFEIIQRAEDGVIEGIVHKNLPITGFQWHPERCCTKEAELLFRFTWESMLQT